MTAFSQLPKVAPPLLAFSLVSNLAVLISPIFMMQVLDRVIPSGNIYTLVLLGLLAVAALALQAFVEGARDMCLGRLSRWGEATGTGQAMAASSQDSTDIIGRTASVSQFLGGQLAIVALSIPWLPVFLLALFLLHPFFGILVLGLVGAAALLRYCADLVSGADVRAATQAAQNEQQSLSHAAQFAAQSGIGMIAQNLRSRYAAYQAEKHACLNRSQGVNAAQTASATFLRSFAQIAALALGAFLVTQNALSAGGMIAGSIIVGKAYGTIDAALAQYSSVRAVFADLRALAGLPPAQAGQNMDIPELSGALRAEALIVPRGQGKLPRLDRVSFALEPGQCLAIVGSSGSGKSTLLHALCGIQPAPIGSVFLDQSEIRGLSDQSLYQHTGFLPQQAMLLPGTLAENIACFSADIDAEKVVAAAKTAGVHGLISALPQSYDSDMGAEPYLLSAGQKQRVALARAIYMSPRYLFLDEPNALLDAEGERALARTLSRLKDQGVTIVMVLHRSGVMGLADKVMQLEHGRIVDFGDRAAVLGRMMSSRNQIELPLMLSSLQDLTDWIATRFTRTSDEAFSQKAQMVGTELFNIAVANAPKDQQTLAKFTFTFQDDTHCEIRMVDEGSVETPQKMERVEAMIHDPKAEIWKLPQDELSLAMVAQLSKRFEVSNIENYALYAAALEDGFGAPPSPIPTKVRN